MGGFWSLIYNPQVSRFFNQWFLDGGNSAGMLAVVAHSGGEVSSHHEMATSIATVLEAKEVSVLLQRALLLLLIYVCIVILTPLVGISYYSSRDLKLCL